MGGSGVMLEMPPKKRKSKGGRPKAPEPVHSIVSLKGTDALADWLDRLTEHSESGTRAHALRRALKTFAESTKFLDPMPKR